MKYDFIEIGTGDFETLIEQATDETVGLSVEPVWHYFSRLEKKQNTQTLNAAVVVGNQETTVFVYYIPEETIKKYDLPEWLRGCNSINRYHYQHIQLDIRDHVVRQEIRGIPLALLFEEYNVEQLDTLKVDTEGMDCDILNNFFNYMKNISSTRWPKNIYFESNILTHPNKVNDVIQLYQSVGYQLIYSNHDTLLQYQSCNHTKREEVCYDEVRGVLVPSCKG